MLHQAQPTSTSKKNFVPVQKGFRPRLMPLEDRLAPAIFDVGFGLAYPSVGSVPWNNLTAGDTVNIHWRSATQGGDYREKINISGQGTAANPIRVIGIPGPNGEKPVINGQNATTGANNSTAYASHQQRGLITFSRSNDSTQNNSTYKPQFITVEGLAVTGAKPANSFRNSVGATVTFTQNAAAFYLERGSNITIRNCDILDSGNGLFAASWPANGEGGMIRDVLVEGNYFYGNGTANGGMYEHNVYTEGVNFTFQYNRFEGLRATANGAQLKDRSAGTIIRYNYFAGIGRTLDLVNAQESASVVAVLPSYRDTYVYGNLLRDPVGPTGAMIHYGGDDGVYATYRKGTLHFYNNTVIIQENQSIQSNTYLFRLDTPDEAADIRNNIIYRSAAAGAQPGTAMTRLILADSDPSSGLYTFGVNWVSSGWLPWIGTAPTGGLITGTANFITNSANDPGFANLTASDFHLGSTSLAIDKSQALDSSSALTNPLTKQYVYHQNWENRSIQGLAADLGAFEFNLGMSNTPPTISDVTNQSSTGSPVGPLAFTVGDAQTAAGSLVVTCSSSNTTLVPLANIVLGGTGVNRIVTVTPAAGQTGSATVTLTVTDEGGLTATDTFILTVTAANTPPMISDIANQSSTGSPVGPLAFTVGDAQTAAGNLTVTRSSSNTTLLPLANIVLGGTGANRTVLVTPAAGQTGSATVTLTVTDEGGLTVTDTFNLTVTAANTPPMISDIANQSSNGSLVGPVAFTLADVQTQANSLVVSAKSSNTTLVPVGNITFGGSDANRTISLLPASGQTGKSTITVTVTDAGGLTASDTFILTVAGKRRPKNLLSSQLNEPSVLLADEAGSRTVETLSESSGETLLLVPHIYLAPTDGLILASNATVTIPLAGPADSTVFDVTIWNLGAEDLSQSDETAVGVPPTFVVKSTKSSKFNFDATLVDFDSVFVG